MDNKLSFLTSTRFWAIVLTAVSVYAKAKGFIGIEEVALINTILGGFVVVRTVDRVADKQVEAANIAAGNVTKEFTV